MPKNQLINDPPNHLKIDAVWMFISVDEDGNEGVCAMPLAGMTMPMIAADEARLDTLRSFAKHLAKLTDKKIVLIKLDQRTDLETIEYEK